MKRSLICLFQAAALALLVFSCGQGQKAVKPPAKGTVRGVVTESGKNLPVGGAVVKVGEDSGMTTPEGSYSLSVTYGNYFVNVTKEGYEPYRSAIEIRIPPDGVVEHDVKIRVKDDKAPQVSEFGVTKRDIAFVEITVKTDEDALAKIEYGPGPEYGRLKSSAQAAREQTIRIDGLDPGTKYQFRMTVQDQHGNVSQPMTGAFETLLPKDTKAPQTQLTKTPAEMSRDASAGFAWTATDDRSPPEKIVFSFCLEGHERNFSPYVSNTTRLYKGLKDGSYTFKIKARDEDGNVEQTVVEYSFTVDTTPPQNPSLLAAGGEKFTGTRAIELVCMAEGAAESSIWEGKETQEGGWTPFKEKKQFVLSLGDGEKIIFAKYRDKAGNATEAVTASIILDTEPPSRPADLKLVSQASTEVQLSWSPAKDTGSGIDSYAVLRDGVEIGKAKGTSYSDRQVKLGRRYAYSVTAIDRLKKASDPSNEVLVTVKGNPPNAPSLPNPPDKSDSQPTGLTLTWTGGDPDGEDEASYDVYFGVESEPPLRASALKSPAFPMSGLKAAQLYNWRVVAKDLQGMETKGPLWSFTTAEQANTAPQAAVSADPQSGPARTSFKFDASQSKDAEDQPQALSFSWDFDGDGKPDTPWRTESSYEKSFLSVGPVTVTVMVKDSRGAVSKASIRIEIKNMPPALAGDPMPLNGSTGEPINAKLAWSFKDDDPGAKLSYDLYFGTGESKLRLLAKKMEQNSYVPPQPLEPGVVYYWRVTAYDEQGAETQGPLWSFATGKKAVKLPLRAEVSVAPKTGKTVTPFRFDASLCQDPDDPPEALRVRWDWDGDGKYDTDLSTAKQVVKTFSRIGSITVGLEVQNSKGQTAKASVGIAVENTAPAFAGQPMPRNGAVNVEPDANLAWDASDPDPGDRTTFIVFLGPAKTGMALAAAASAANTFKPQAPFEGGETYNWKIVAEDSNGGKTESPVWAFTVKKRENNPPMRPVILEAKDKVRLNQRAVFTAKSRDPEGEAVKVRFDWGDNTVSPWSETGSDGSVQLSHLYAKEGSYEVKAQAMDGAFTHSEWSEPMFIAVLPKEKEGEEEEDLWHWHPDTRRNMADLLTVKARYWFANLGGSGIWKGVGDPLAELDFRSDLGISERKGAPGGLIEFGKYLSAGAEYFFLEYAGESSIPQDSVFGGSFLPAGLAVKCTDKIRFGHIYMGFAPYLGDYFGGGIKIGGGYFWNKTTVTPTAPAGDTEVESIEFPVPLLGIRLYGRLTKYITVALECSYIEGGLQEFNMRRGRLFDISGEVLFTPVPYIGIALGYRYSSLKARITEGSSSPDSKLDLVLDGFHLAFMVHL